MADQQAKKQEEQQLSDLQKLRNETNQKKDYLTDEIKVLENGNKNFKKIDISEELGSIIAHFEGAADLREGFAERADELRDERAGLEEKRQETFEAIKQYKERAFSLRWTLEDLRDSVAKHVDIDEEVTPLDNLLGAFDELGDRDNFDLDKFRTFLKSKLKPILNRLNPSYLRKLRRKISPALRVGYANSEIGGYLKASSKLFNQLEKNIYILDDSEDIDLIDSEVKRLESLRDQIDNNFPSEVNELHITLDYFDDDVRKFQSTIASQTAYSSDFLKSINERCDKYLRAYKNFQWEPIGDLTYKHFQVFVQNEYQPFIDELYRILDQALDAKQSELNSVDTDVEKFNEEPLAAPWTISDEMPEKALDAVERVEVLREGARAEVNEAFSNEKSDKDTSIRAFEIVRGESLTEQIDPELDKPDGVFMSTMKRVLGKESYEKIEDSLAIKSAKAELSALASEVRKNTKIADDILDAINSNSNTLSSVKPIIDGLSGVVNTKFMFDVAIIKKKLDKVRSNITDFLGSDSVGQLFPDIQKKWLDFLRVFDDFFDQPNDEIIAYEVRKIFGDFNALVSEFEGAAIFKKDEIDKDLSAYRRDISVFDSQKIELPYQRVLKRAFPTEDDLSSLETKRETLNTKVSEYEDLEIVYKKIEYQATKKADVFVFDLAKEIAETTNTAEIFDLLDRAKEKVSHAKNHRKLPDKLRDECQAYLDEYRKIHERYEDPNDDVTGAEILDFVNVHAGRFSEDFRPVLDTLYNSLVSSSDDAEIRLLDTETELASLQTERNEAISRSSDLDSQIGSLETEQSDLTDKISKYNDLADFYKQLDRFADQSAKLVPTFVKICDNTDDIQSIFDKLDQIRERILLIKNKENLPDDLQIVCQGYIDAYDKLKGRYENPEIDLPKSKIVEFIDIHAFRFSNGFGDVLRTLNDSLLSDLDRTRVKLSKIETELPNLQTDREMAVWTISDFESQISTLEEKQKTLINKINEYRASTDFCEELNPVAEQADNFASELTRRIETSNVAKYFDLLDRAKNEVSHIKNRNKLPDELRGVCQVYLGEYNKLRKRHEDPDDNVTRTEILDFVDVHGGRFSEDFRSVFNELNNSLASDLKEARARMSYIARLGQEAKEWESANTNLDDVQVAKRIIETIVAEQYPDLSLEKCQQLASATYIQTLQTGQSYQEAGPEPIDIPAVGIQDKLVNFRYKLNDKIVQPFKKFKPTDFASLERMEELFYTGRLNRQNGFFVLAAFEYFAGKGKTSKQAEGLKRKLTLLLRKELGKDEGKAGKAFSDQMRKIKPLVSKFLDFNATPNSKLKDRKTQELEMRIKALNEQLRLGKIEKSVYELRRKQILEEATANGIKDRLSQSTALSGFWNSKHSQWLRDSGYALGSYGARKTKAVGFAGLELYGRGLWGATKLAFSTAWNGVTRVPFRAIKNTAVLAATPLKGLVNLKRWISGQKYWTPFSIAKNVKEDVAGIKDFVSKKGTETFEGTKTAFKTVPGKYWGKEAWKSKKYAGRTTVDTGSLESQADELKKAAEIPCAKIDVSPFIDLKSYRDKKKKKKSNKKKSASDGSGAESAAA